MMQKCDVTHGVMEGHAWLTGFTEGFDAKTLHHSRGSQKALMQNRDVTHAGPEWPFRCLDWGYSNLKVLPKIYHVWRKEVKDCLEYSFWWTFPDCLCSHFVLPFLHIFFWKNISLVNWPSFQHIMLPIPFLQRLWGKSWQGKFVSPFYNII